MTVIIRYIMREYLKVFALCEGGLLAVFTLVDFFEKLSGFIEHNAPLTKVAAYVSYKLPEIALYVTPMAILMATLITLGLMVRSHEIVAMKSCGMNLLRLTAPLGLFGLLVSLMFLSLGQSLIPEAHWRAEWIRQAEIEGQQMPTSFHLTRLWFRQGDETVVHASAFEPQQGILLGVNLYRLGQDFTLPEEIEAKELRYEEGQWMLRAGTRRVFHPDGSIEHTPFDRHPVALEGTPEQFHRVRVHPEEMTAGELQRYIEQLTRYGYPSAAYRINLEARWAFPFASLIMVIFGVALALREWRLSNIAVAIATSLVVIFGYFFLYSLMLSLGRGGLIPAPLAAWAANLLFLSLGCLVLRTVHQ